MKKMLMVHECHSLSNTFFARSLLSQIRVQELDVVVIMMRTHELSAENLKWGGVGELLALIIWAGLILRNKNLNRHEYPMYIILTSF